LAPTQQEVKGKRKLFEKTSKRKLGDTLIPVPDFNGQWSVIKL